MNYKSKVNAQIFGYIDTTEIPYNIEKDKKYTIIEKYSDKYKKEYYEIIENNKVVTTISKDEFKIFFEI